MTNEEFKRDLLGAKQSKYAEVAEEQQANKRSIQRHRQSEKFAIELFKGCAAFILVLVSAIWLGHLFSTGPLGDPFVPLGTLFSGLAFSGLVVTILLQRRDLRLQRRELRLQRKELRLTRRELKRSASAQEKSEHALREQGAVMALQAFEGTYFSLLRQVAEILLTIGYGERERFTSGSEALIKYCRDLRIHFDRHVDKGNSVAEAQEFAWVDIREQVLVKMNHYFHFVVETLKFLDRSTLDRRQKQVYSDMLRAQLSQSELLMLVFAASFGDMGLSDLAGRYGLFSLLYSEPFEVAFLKIDRSAFRSQGDFGNMALTASETTADR